jgi:hypothetical protein
MCCTTMESVWTPLLYAASVETTNRKYTGIIAFEHSNIVAFGKRFATLNSTIQDIPAEFANMFCTR